MEEEEHPPAREATTEQTLSRPQTDGSKPKSTTVMGRRNYCMGDYDPATGEVQFTVCVEKSQGSGTTKE